MSKLSFLSAWLVILTIQPARAAQYYMVDYQPMSQAECENQQEQLGIKYCPYDNDHLAGAIAACGGVDNMPTMNDLLVLAKSLYKNKRIESNGTSLYGIRDDTKMRKLGIWFNDSHIFYWSNEEAKDGVGGYVRMFASRGSIPYYAPRDGSGYVSHSLGKIEYGQTKNVVPVKVNTQVVDRILKRKKTVAADEETEAKSEAGETQAEDENEEIIRVLKLKETIEADNERDSNLSGLPNEDVLLTICIKREE